MSLWSDLKRRLFPRTPAACPQDREEAVNAKHAARQTLHQTRERSAEVHRVTQQLREMREQNHFGAAIEAAMLKRR